MGRDGELALAIFIVMFLLVLGGLLLGGLLGWTMARRFGWSRNKLLLITLGLGAIGSGGGILAVIATFYEDMWAPPPQVTLNVPPGFTQGWFVLLEDPKSSAKLEWEGLAIPLVTKKTVIDVPASGIVRVRDLSALLRPGTIQWSDGSCNTGYRIGYAPESTGAILYMAFNRLKSDCDASHSPWPGEEAFRAYIEARERGVR